MTDPHAFELVLHHRYENPQPHDLSGHGSLGYAPAARAEGRDGRPGAAVFDGAGDRVFVPPTPALTRPGGLRVDVSVRVEEFGHRRTLVEGYLSFAVFVERDGTLAGSLYRYQEWTGVASRPGLVPLDRWITVTFVAASDGTMFLIMDGETVASAYRELGPPAGVEWPFGLSVGAWPDADRRVLKGRVDELKVWRAFAGPRGSM
ncbi:MAG TPA: hypothetical protein VLL08_09075 [Kineosporiaceae bacterium]|nr:hypothetical protein [Kineosporiaceae bacterium]